MINVNYPIGALQVTHPEIAQKLLNSQAAGIMTDPLFNFQEIATPMDKWHFLFDRQVARQALLGQGTLRQANLRLFLFIHLAKGALEREPTQP